MRAGNKQYRKISDFPTAVPIFPLSGALLLPGGNLPLNIFESRYLAMIDHSLCTDRLIGMIQPDLSGRESSNGPALCKIGCLGRLTGFQETGDGRYMINLSGVCRFRYLGELEISNGYRRAEIEAYSSDLIDEDADEHETQPINRKLLLETFKKYLAANEMDTDWDAVERTDDQTLVTALCMMSPYGPAEKQALLEAESLHMRAETLVALTEIALAKSNDDQNSILQ
ncbi:MAG: LON peptidase substrate-binding domain-containing protein [Salaquimonas sp.]